MSKCNGINSSFAKLYLITGCILIALVCTGVFFLLYYKGRCKQDEEKQTNPIFAEIALKNLAVGMRTYSAMTGGGGDENFTEDISKIREYVMPEIYNALNENHRIPYNGYIIEMKEKPSGDNFKSNFMFVAHPSSGYIGESFQIDKFEQIQPFK